MKTLQTLQIIKRNFPCRWSPVPLFCSKVWDWILLFPDWSTFDFGDNFEILNITCLEGCNHSIILIKASWPSLLIHTHHQRALPFTKSIWRRSLHHFKLMKKLVAQLWRGTEVSHFKKNFNMRISIHWSY